MENIRRRSNKAYILLESLLTLSLLAMITSLMLTGITNSQKHSKTMNRQIESLNLARMAIDKKTENLSGNGVAVVLERNQKIFKVKDASGKEMIRLEILEIQK